MGILVAPRPLAAPVLPLPSVLHVGSGKNFQPGWLNIDIEPRWRPDVVQDLSQPLPPEGWTFTTERFGRIRLAAETFDEAIAIDVLEHIRDLPAAMTTVLTLLKTGGVFRIAVPYELSLGAWADPTHVRAFNERSFDYYTRWSWYLGWRTHHFHLRKCEFIASDFGRQLSAAGKSLEEVLRTPRAVDQICVELEKRVLDQEQQKITAYYLERTLA
ncbi:MAG: methyltransferase domain-containing protein [Planctomycetes bacterium]|nr:methyltransferase domain-containing protein [Planctomycetota bacterium]